MEILGGPGAFASIQPHMRLKTLTMGFDDKNKLLKYQNGRRMTSLASERYLFRWLSTTMVFDMFFFVSRVFVGWVFVCTSSNFTGLNMVGVFSTNDVLENSGQKPLI